LKEMFNESLGSIYHSKICHPKLREKIIEDLNSREMMSEGQEPDVLQKISPFKDIDIHQFAKMLYERATSFAHSV
jgi:mannosyl-3-phosphoglycerate synthase